MKYKVTLCGVPLILNQTQLEILMTAVQDAEQLGEKTGTMVIDQLDWSRGSQDDQLWLRRVLDRRYAWMKRTVLVCNGDLDTFRACIASEPIINRIQQTGVIVGMGGRNLRNGRA